MNDDRSGQRERRHADAATPVATTRGPGTRLRVAFEQMNLPDLWDTRRHARDFCDTRAGYLNRRIRPLALLLLFGLPLWLPLEAWLLQPGELASTAALRLGGAVAGLALWLACRRGAPIAPTRWHLGLLLLIPMTIYVMVRLVLDHEPDSALAADYAFFPALTLAALAIFPLTLREGLVYSLAIIVAFAGVEVVQDTLLDWRTLGQFWLLFLVAGIALWAALGQLHMMLRLYRQATRDPLTGLFNRRALIERMQQQLLALDRRGQPFALLMLDLDRFKRINDTHGHQLGDQVLETVAGVLRDASRETDVAGRWGGEEFLVALPGTMLEDAREVAERLREQIRATPVPLPDGGSLTVTASIGLATREPGEALDDLVLRADEALYAAKAAGRDCVVPAEPGQGP